MDILTALYVLAGYLLILTVAAVLADHVAPHIKPLTRWMNTLPLIQQTRPAPKAKTHTTIDQNKDLAA